jgi:hypothetical protein
MRFFSLSLSHFACYVVNSHSLTPFFVEIFQSTDFRFVWFGICFLSARLELLLTIQNKRVIRLFHIELFRRYFLLSSSFSYNFFSPPHKNFFGTERSRFKLFKFLNVEKSFVSVFQVRKSNIINE